PAKHSVFSTTTTPSPFTTRCSANAVTYSPGNISRKVHDGAYRSERMMATQKLSERSPQKIFARPKYSRNMDSTSAVVVKRLCNKPALKKESTAQKWRKN